MPFGPLRNACIPTPTHAHVMNTTQRYLRYATLRSTTLLTPANGAGVAWFANDQNFVG
jgi:hypothetical protein